MMIMTHGGIANVVPEIGTALSFESGKSWSEVVDRPQTRVDQVLPSSNKSSAPSSGQPSNRCLDPLYLNPVVNLDPLTLRE
jgi:hypothetical protein